MNTQENNLNDYEVQENKENKENKDQSMDGVTIAMTAAGLTAAGVVGAKIIDYQQQPESTDEQASIPQQAPHPQQEAQVQEPQPEEQVAEVVQAELDQELLANANEPTPIAPDSPGTPEDLLASTTPITSTDTDNLMAEAEVEDPMLAEIMAIAEQVAEEDGVPIEIEVGDSGDGLAANDHANEDIPAEELAPETEVIEEDLLSELDSQNEDDDLAMEEYESPDGIMNGDDVVDDII